MPVSRTTSVLRTTEIFREAGTSLVLREAFFGVRRFEDLQRNLGISRSVLSRCLKSLVERGILERREYQLRPRRYEYRLTESGRELYPIFIAMRNWGDRWLGDDSPPVLLIHEVCGEACNPVMTCDGCGRPIRANEMSYRLDPDSESLPQKGS